MNNRKTTLRSFFLTICFLVYGFSVVAQDIIRFTWESDTNRKNLTITATIDKKFTVDWGDKSNLETYIGNNNDQRLIHTYNKTGTYIVTIAAITKDCCFTMFYCSNNQITNLDVSNSTALQFLYCSKNQLRNLDVSNNKALIQFACPDNQLICLDVSNNTALETFYCMNNRLPLSDLFTVSEMIDVQNKKYLGTQILIPQVVAVGDMVDFSTQATFDGITTDFDIEKDGITATRSDYTINNGIITFTKIGNYKITMTNEAIVSDTNYPAKVIAEFIVGEVGIVGTERAPSLQVYPNPTDGQLTVGIAGQTSNDGIGIEIFNVVGQVVGAYRIRPENNETTVDINNLSNGMYFLKIDGKMYKIVKN
jgi:hypothetical protein